MVDLTRTPQGKVKARLLDLVPGRSGAAYNEWLQARNKEFRDGIEIATLDPFHGYKNAIDDQLDDAIAVLDAFHVVKLGTTALDQVRRRVQQDTLGHRGRNGDPLYGIRNLLRAGAERSPTSSGPGWRTRSTPTRRTSRSTSPGRVPSSCARPTATPTPPRAARSPSRSSTSFPTCPIPEIKRLGRTLKQWREAFLAYFDTDRSNNGGTEAINGLIELHRRVARGFRNYDNYRLRMLLIGGGLSSPHLK